MPETKFFEYEITLSAQSEPARLKFPAKLAFWTLGNPSNPAILLPTFFGGKLEEALPFLYTTEQSSAILPPSKYFIIVAGLLGGGESSSPSNTPEPYHGPHFPRTTYEDNIRLQHALCASLGIEKLFGYIGGSMGGQQAYHMSALYPDFVENIVCLSGSARSSAHNWSVLEGLKYSLTQSSDFHDGGYKEQASKGLKAFDMGFITWSLSPAWFRQKCWEKSGFKTLQEYLDVNCHGEGDANDSLLMLWTWQHGDIAVCFPEDEGDLTKTLGRIKAKCLIIPSKTDLFFLPQENEEEVVHLKYGEIRCIESVYGHLAGIGFGAEEDTDFIIEEIARFLRL